MGMFCACLSSTNASIILICWLAGCYRWFLSLTLWFPSLYKTKLCVLINSHKSDRQLGWEYRNAVFDYNGNVNFNFNREARAALKCFG